MKAFVSWSGKRSRLVADALCNWLPMILNVVRPYVTSRDLDKGTVWSTEIMSNLADARIGIICLTEENLRAPWILFEAGALSKAVAGPPRVYTYLLGVQPANVPPPLSMFQATIADEADTKEMVRSMNALLVEGRVPDEILDQSFPLLWPRLQVRLLAIPGSVEPEPIRPDTEKLDEILEVLRGLAPSVAGIPLSRAEPFPNRVAVNLLLDAFVREDRSKRINDGDVGSQIAATELVNRGLAEWIEEGRSFRLAPLGVTVARDEDRRLYAKHPSS
jgi:hypothetical protein